ncbi:MAG: universal stress protein [Rickettsiales bacterium]
MYNNILYPIDIYEKESWLNSLPIVTEYAVSFEATVHIMTAIPDYGMALVSQYFPKSAVDKVIENTKEELHKFVEDKFNNSQVNIGNIIVKKGGSVYQSIIDVAEKIDADLILVSAHRPELKDYLLGPNAAKVVRHSKRSVLVMR